MKRIKSSVFLKLIAWIVFILSLNIFVFSTVVMLLIAECGLYHKSYTDVRTDLFGGVNRNYSTQALAWMGQGKEEYFGEQSFEYAIAKAENWDRDLLKDPTIYEETNFDLESIKEGQWRIYMNRISENTVLETTKDMWGDTYYYLNEPYPNEVTGHYAEKIVYDEHTGVIYYLSEGEYYPAKTVQINFVYQYEPMIFIYEYQFGENHYLLRDMWAMNSDGDSHSYSTQGIDIEDMQNAENKISSVLACDLISGVGSSFNFTRLEEVGYSFYNLGDIILDEVRTVHTSEIDAMDSSSL